MPPKIQVIEIDQDVQGIQVVGRLEVAAPFFGGGSGRDVKAALLGKSLAARIERGIRTAIIDFGHDFSLADQPTSESPAS